MFYMIHCTDKSNHQQLRLDTREAHLDYLHAFKDSVFAAGPLLSEQGDMTGSVLIMNFDSLEDAKHFANDDPYRLAGLFSEVTITRWKKVLPA